MKKENEQGQMQTRRMNKDMELKWMILREISQGAKFFFLMMGIAFAALVIANEINQREQKRVDATENETILTTHLAEMARTYYLLHSLRAAEKDAVSQCLSLQLVDEIKHVRAAAKKADASQQAFAEGLCKRILRDKQWHPDYYLSGSPKTRSGEELAWKVLEDESIASVPASDGGRLKATMHDENN